ncbi:MAG: hypothetical protein BGO14_02990 [Chlamydiales bacterium 38-26]|nr:hypothetical protein [Chlamydiales bacterium]OJV09308.1 MAG: hypothetical protein BGO14_02990 [Chlamydiales bacterium 38-26]
MHSIENFSQLPPELQSYIFSCATHGVQAIMGLTCKKWSEEWRSVSYAEDKMFWNSFYDILKEYNCIALLENLDVKSKCIKTIHHVRKLTKISGSVDKIRALIFLSKIGLGSLDQAMQLTHQEIHGIHTDPYYDLCLELLRIGDLYKAEKYIQCMPFGEDRSGKIALEIINGSISQNELRKSIRYFRYIEPMSTVSFKAIARIVWNAAQAGDIETVIVALSHSKKFMEWESCVVNAALDFKEKGRIEEYERVCASFPDVFKNEKHVLADVRYYIENDQLSKAEKIASAITSLLSQIQAFKFIRQAYKSIHDAGACERLKKLISILDDGLENDVNSSL